MPHLKKQPNYVEPQEVILGPGHSFMYVPLKKTVCSLLNHDDIMLEVLNGHARQDGLLGDVVDALAYKTHPLFGLDSRALTLIFYLGKT